MLVLGIKVGDSVFIDDGKTKLTVLSTQGNQVKIGFEADKSISIDRQIVHNAKKEQAL